MLLFLLEEGLGMLAFVLLAATESDRFLTRQSV